MLDMSPSPMGSQDQMHPVEPKMAHVNLMTDTVIANLPEEGLRSVLRSMLAADPSITSLLEQRARNHLQKTLSFPHDQLFPDNTMVTGSFRSTQQRARSMLGCGMCYESMAILTGIVNQASTSIIKSGLSDELLQALATVDGDIVQALTAVQKALLVATGTRPLVHSEKIVVQNLLNAVGECLKNWKVDIADFIFERSLTALRAPSLGLQDITGNVAVTRQTQKMSIVHTSSTLETFQLNGKVLPRLFSGLWQLSSPSWGTASTQQIRRQFESYACKGFTAYDMADHYGDAEVIFGGFRSSCSNPEVIFGATKYCIFTPTAITREVVQSNITERCQRMASKHIDLLQFHWQDYDDPQYIEALRYIQEDPRVKMVGLCNFDTQRMLEAVQASIEVRTNQVQFSLVDSRPTFAMGAACIEHNVKLLTYGTLCGGFLAEKWLGQGEPELFLDDITPSQRKYYEMILNWGGWSLFQKLLQILKMIAIKHDVSVSNVATRWVLDFPYVGAVIIGTRMGVSGHAEENLKTFGWRLDEDDQNAIQTVIARSKRDDLVAVLGDCGGEYR